MLLNALLLALRAIRRNLMRSFLTVLGVVAGAVRTRPVPPSPIASGLLARLTAVCVGSVTLVIAIDAVFH